MYTKKWGAHWHILYVIVEYAWNVACFKHMQM